MGARIHIPELVVIGVSYTDLVTTWGIAIIAAIDDSHLIVGLE